MSSRVLARYSVKPSFCLNHFLQDSGVKRSRTRCPDISFSLEVDYFGKPHFFEIRSLRRQRSKRIDRILEASEDYLVLYTKE